MRKLRFRNLEKYRVGGTGDHMQLALPVPKSPSGKIYQYSPNPDAKPRLFLIGGAPDDRAISESDRKRIRRNPGPGQTVCPYSGFIDDDDKFIHGDDIEAIKKHAFWMAENDVNDFLGDWAKDFNRRQSRGGFISMKMEHKPRRRPKPLTIREDLLRSLECELCHREYGVYALALFCPDCGAPNVALHFRREAALVGEQIDLADELDQKGNIEIAYRLMGNAHEDVLTAFEATLKSVHAHLVRTHLPDQAEQMLGKKAVGNAFQNVERGRRLFAELGIDPFDVLEDDGVKHIQLNAEKRHVLGHNLGIADDHYASFAEDLEPGETVTLIGEDIRRFSELCLKVVARLEDSLLPNQPVILPEK